MGLPDVWFFLWGVLWAVYFALDGFDLGIGMLLPFVPRTGKEKRLLLAAMGPLWDGNEVWLVAAGGVTFAAFPRVYAVMFSALYLPLLFILFGLILRGAGLEFRRHSESRTWRAFWDACVFLGSLVPALLFGVAFANIFSGIPIDGQGVFQGTLLTLLNPYGLLGGALFVLLFVMHGALWLGIRLEGPLRDRALAVARGFWPAAVLCAACFLVVSFFSTGLFINYNRFPALYLVPGLAVVALIVARLCVSRQSTWGSWAASGAAIMACVFFGLVGLYPNLLPSSISPDFHLSARNAASSPLTLKIMLIVVVIFLPIVIAYQTWAYSLFSRKLTEKDLKY